MSRASKPKIRQNRRKQGLNLTLEKLSADFRININVKTVIFIIGFAISAIVMLAFAIYEMKHAYEVDPNDETFLD